MPTFSGLVTGRLCHPAPGARIGMDRCGIAVHRSYGWVVADGDSRAGQPFSYATRADGTIVILYRAAPLTLLRGKTAARFASRIELADAAAAQLLMARASGATVRHRAPREGKRPPR